MKRSDTNIKAGAIFVESAPLNVSIFHSFHHFSPRPQILQSPQDFCCCLFPCLPSPSPPTTRFYGKQQLGTGGEWFAGRGGRQRGRGSAATAGTVSLSGTASAVGGSRAAGSRAGAGGAVRGLAGARAQPLLESMGRRPELSSSQALPCLWVSTEKCVRSQALPDNRELWVRTECNFHVS